MINPPEHQDQSFGRTLPWIGYMLVLAVVGGIVFLVIRELAAGGTAAGETAPITRVAEEVRAGRVQRITVRGDALTVELTDQTHLRSHKEEGVSLGTALREYGATREQLDVLTVQVMEPVDLGWLWPLVWLVPLSLVALVLFRRQRTAGGADGPSETVKFLRSRARKVAADRPSERPLVRFGDVAGIDEAKEELQEVVELLRYPERFTDLGARLPRGVLLSGPPGTGKTLLAKAVAGEARVPFFSQSASEFVELFVGVGASRVRDLFEQARANAPCVVFIDEIDAVGRRRGGGMGQSHEEREQTLNQILTELDGFDGRANVVVIAATNRPDVLDPALLRPGRFDRRVTLDAPDLEGRVAILRVHARCKPLDRDLRVEDLARLTPGFSGADLENLLNEAALLAGRRRKKAIGMAEVEEATDRVMTGPQRRGQCLSPREREVTAYHEGGHALVAHLLPYAPPVRKVSIVARGPAGGHTWVVPDEERHFWTRSQLEDTLAYMLGGMAAEELVFGEPTTGPGNDLEKATRLARKLVVEYGMSERLGPLSFGPDEAGQAAPWAGREWSDETAAEVDAEVRRLVGAARERAAALLARHRSRLDSFARVLRERETLRGDELRDALGPTDKAA